MSKTAEVAATLTAAIQLLTRAGEAAWASRLQRILNQLQDDSATSQQAAIRQILTLYQQGMGGFQDVVLQDSSGALPAQRDLDRLRRRLFEEARGQLG
jgi:regulator of protease activity HflC (stomatin/prohibitin superfamily)